MSSILFNASSSPRFIANNVPPTLLHACGLAVLEDNFYRLKQIQTDTCNWLVIKLIIRVYFLWPMNSYKVV